VEAGLALLDPDAGPTLADLRLERAFQMYGWDEQSESFKVAE
jgi:hypothetical protein